MPGVATGLRRRLIEPLELRLKRRRGPPKLCLCDHALQDGWLAEYVPIDPAGLETEPHLADLAGRIADSTAGYFMRSIVNLDVAYSPERSAEPEFDYVITIGEQRLPIEVKYTLQLHKYPRGSSGKGIEHRVAASL